MESIHFFAVASGGHLVGADVLATGFWSSLVQLKFLIMAAACFGRPILVSGTWERNLLDGDPSSVTNDAALVKILDHNYKVAYPDPRPR